MSPLEAAVVIAVLAGALSVAHRLVSAKIKGAVMDEIEALKRSRQAIWDAATGLEKRAVSLEEKVKNLEARLTQVDNRTKSLRPG